MVKQYLTHKDPRIRKIAKEVLTFYEKKEYYEASTYVTGQMTTNLFDNYNKTLEEIEKKIWKKIGEEDYAALTALCIKVCYIILAGITVYCLMELLL